MQCTFCVQPCASLLFDLYSRRLQSGLHLIQSGEDLCDGIGVVGWGWGCSGDNTNSIARRSGVSGNGINRHYVSDGIANGRIVRISHR